MDAGDAIRVMAERFAEFRGWDGLQDLSEFGQQEREGSKSTERRLATASVEKLIRHGRTRW
jgi:hypothetical protein